MEALILGGMLTLGIGGSKGGARDSPSLDPISFIFMQFLKKTWPNKRLAPLPLVSEILHLPLLGINGIRVSYVQNFNNIDELSIVYIDY